LLADSDYLGEKGSTLGSSLGAIIRFAFGLIGPAGISIFLLLPFWSEISIWCYGYRAALCDVRALDLAADRWDALERGEGLPTMSASYTYKGWAARAFGLDAMSCCACRFLPSARRPTPLLERGLAFPFFKEATGG